MNSLSLPTPLARAAATVRAHPRALRLAFLALLLLAAAWLRCYEISLPFFKVHEAAFQESLAINHLDFGLVHNHFLSLLAEVDGVEFFHVSHPPLLQYVLAFFFTLFGISEAVARVALLPFSLGTVYLTYRIAELEISPSVARLAALFVSFSLLSSYFSRVVNYEVMAQFFALAVFWAFLRHRRRPTRWNLLLLVSLFVLGCLSDWPFYLVLPALFAYPLLRPVEGRSSWRQFLLPVCLLLGGLATVGLYLLYQQEVTGLMMLLGHGRNRMGGNLLLDPSFYALLGSRLLRYAPLLCALAPVGLLVALDREPKRLLPVLPLLFVAIAYVVLFAQAAQVHEWCLYYFAVPMSLLGAIALDGVVIRRRWLLPLLGLLIAAGLTHKTLAFHREAKQSVFAELYDVSAFMARHVPPESLVYSAIYGQMGYYLEDRAEVLYPFAKGDLRGLRFDCYVLDRAAPDDPTRRKLLPEGTPSGYRTQAAGARYELTCRDSLFDGHFLLGEPPQAPPGETAPALPRLVRFGEEVRLTKSTNLAFGSNRIRLGRSEGPLRAGDRLRFSFAYPDAPWCLPVDLRVVATPVGGKPVELLQREVAAQRGRWWDLGAPLGELAGRPADFEIVVQAPSQCGAAYLGDPEVEPGTVAGAG